MLQNAMKASAGGTGGSSSPRPSGPNQRRERRSAPPRERRDPRGSQQAERGQGRSYQQQGDASGRRMFAQADLSFYQRPDTIVIVPDADADALGATLVSTMQANDRGARLVVGGSKSLLVALRAIVKAEQVLKEQGKAEPVSFRISAPRFKLLAVTKTRFKAQPLLVYVSTLPAPTSQQAAAGAAPAAAEASTSGAAGQPVTIDGPLRINSETRAERLSGFLRQTLTQYAGQPLPMRFVGESASTTALIALLLAQTSLRGKYLRMVTSISKEPMQTSSPDSPPITLEVMHLQVTALPVPAREKPPAAAAEASTPEGMVLVPADKWRELNDQIDAMAKQQKELLSLTMSLLGEKQGQQGQQ